MSIRSGTPSAMIKILNIVYLTSDSHTYNANVSTNRLSSCGKYLSGTIVDGY